MATIETWSRGIRRRRVRRVADLRLRGPAGSIPVRVRWPTSPASEPPPLVLFLPDAAPADGVEQTDDELALQLCWRAGAVVLCTPWAPRRPGALDRAEAALMWVADHGQELGADPARLAVAGRGAGAAAASALARRARDRGWPAIRGQGLVVGDDELNGIEALVRSLRAALSEREEDR
jgi:acetyl esterase